MFRNSRRIFSSWRFCSVPYVLIGGGTASYYAALTIRARDPEAKVLIISEENESPYNRQLLSKEVWWYGNENTPKSLSYISPASGKRRDLPYESDGFYPKLEDFSSEIDATTSSEYSHGGIALLKNSKAVKVDSEKHWVELMDGKKISFKKCLLATGSRLKDLDVLDKSDSRKAELKKSISKFTNVDDYRNLDAVIKSKENSRIGIVGGGFLGSELAYSLNRRYGQDQKKNDGPSVEVVMMFPEAGLLSSALPPLLSDYATRRMRDRGVRVLPSHQIKSAAVLENGQLELRMGDLTNVLKKESASNGKGQHEKGEVQSLVCDHVLAVYDSEPNVELAVNSGLKLDEVNGGILADSKMHVKDDIWAAGDVCSYDDPVIGKRRRVQHWEHAQITGRVAGENMTGGNKTFFHEGAFVSIFGGGDQISAVGDVDSSLDTISYLIEGTGPDEARDGDAPMKSIVFYLANCRHSSERRIVGILFYNLYEGLDLEMARKIIKDGKEISNQETFADLARLFGIIHDDLPEVKEEKELIEPEKEVLVEKESKV